MGNTMVTIPEVDIHGTTRNFVKHESTHTTKIARKQWSMFMTHDILIWNHNSGGANYGKHHGGNPGGRDSWGNINFCQTWEFTYHKMTRNIWSMFIIHKKMIWHHLFGGKNDALHNGSDLRCWFPRKILKTVTTPMPTRHQHTAVLVVFEVNGRSRRWLDLELRSTAETIPDIWTCKISYFNSTYRGRLSFHIPQK